MTREDAEKRVREMNAEHPERALYRWVARPAGPDWEVVRVKLPGRGRDVLREGTEAEEKPPQADDPRTAAQRNAPGAWG